jgi:hypothetical protein
MCEKRKNRDEEKQKNVTPKIFVTDVIHKRRKIVVEVVIEIVHKSCRGNLKVVVIRAVPVVEIGVMRINLRVGH